MNANSANPADSAVGDESPAKHFPNTRRCGAAAEPILMGASTARSCECSGAKGPAKAGAALSLGIH